VGAHRDFIFALVRFEIGLWPAVFAGAFLANLLTGAPPGVALGIATGNTLEAVVATRFLSAAGFQSSFERGPRRARARAARRRVVHLAERLAGRRIADRRTCRAPALSATTWRSWWLGDLMGAITVAPLLFVWSEGLAFPALTQSRALVLVLTLAGSVGLVFGHLFGEAERSPLGQGYLLFPALLGPPSASVKRPR